MQCNKKAKLSKETAHVKRGNMTISLIKRQTDKLTNSLICSVCCCSHNWVPIQPTVKQSVSVSVCGGSMAGHNYIDFYAEMNDTPSENQSVSFVSFGQCPGPMSMFVRSQTQTLRTAPRLASSRIAYQGWSGAPVPINRIHRIPIKSQAKQASDSIMEIDRQANVSIRMYVTVPRHVRSWPPASHHAIFHLFRSSPDWIELHRRIEHPLCLIGAVGINCFQKGPILHCTVSLPFRSIAGYGWVWHERIDA